MLFIIRFYHVKLIHLFMPLKSCCTPFKTKKICDIIGSRINKEPVYHIEPGNASDLIGDNSLMKERLHYPLISIQNGIEDLII